MNYYRNVDDSISDPELIEAKYKIGRSAYFEVQITLAEYSDSIRTATGGLAGSPNLIQAIGLEAPVGVGGGCPRIDQFFWVERNYLPAPITGEELYKNYKTELMYDPISGKFSKILEIEKIDQPLVRILTKRNARLFCSQAHTVIRNTQDKDGIPINTLPIRSEILSFNIGNIFIDQLVRVSPAGFGTTLQIKLKENFIYVAGSTHKQGIVSHNLKPPPVDF